MKKDEYADLIVDLERCASYSYTCHDCPYYNDDEDLAFCSSALMRRAALAIKKLKEKKYS